MENEDKIIQNNIEDIEKEVDMQADSAEDIEAFKESETQVADLNDEEVIEKTDEAFQEEIQDLDLNEIKEDFEEASEELLEEDIKEVQEEIQEEVQEEFEEQLQEEAIIEQDFENNENAIDEKNVVFESIETNNLVDIDNTLDETLQDDGLITVRPVKFQQFEKNVQNRAIKKNLDIMQDISMHVSVELGRTKSSIREVMEMEEGSVVELEKIAGEQVEIFVNDKLVAKGEVIVIEDKFGVRITSTSIQNQVQ